MTMSGSPWRTRPAFYALAPITPSSAAISSAGGVWTEAWTGGCIDDGRRVSSRK
ncbi:hypothetical protein [Inquilinus sp. CA228]|uniref:hypothetical protein n=1 Tax=Inquilinus sp. CA228 TaxID=3455609 RepID=UPI003F8D5709